MDDSGRGRQTEGLDAVHALLKKRVVEFHAGRVCLVFPRRHDDDSTVAGAQVEHLLSGFQAAKLQHFVDDDLRSRIVWREFLNLLAGLFFLGCKKQRKSAEKGSLSESHQYILWHHLV